MGELTTGRLKRSDRIGSFYDDSTQVVTPGSGLDEPTQIIASNPAGGDC